MMASLIKYYIRLGGGSAAVTLVVSELVVFGRQCLVVGDGGNNLSPLCMV